MTTRLVAAAALALLCACQSTNAPAPTASPSAPASASASPTPAPTPSPSPSPVPRPSVAASSPPAAPVGWTLGYARRDLTPGVRNPAVTQATIGTTICVRGWTATIRPPVSYTNRDPASVEEDHLLPLEGGGSPTDPRNLWPQPRYGTVTAAQKDVAEKTLQTAVCSGAATLDAAQAAFLAKWVR